MTYPVVVTTVPLYNLWLSRTLLNPRYHHDDHWSRPLAWKSTSELATYCNYKRLLTVNTLDLVEYGLRCEPGRVGGHLLSQISSKDKTRELLDS